MRAAVLGVLVWLLSPSAHAQTLKDKLKDHVREGLERTHEKGDEPLPDDEKDDAPAAEPSEPPAAPKPEPPKPEAPKPEPERQASPARDAGPDEPKGQRIDLIELIAGDAPAEAPEGPKLPVRVFGDQFKLDIKLGGSYRGWYPQQYDAVDVDVGNYATWNVEVKAKIFKFLNLRRGYYESNGIAGPRTEEAAVAAQIGDYVPKAAWLLGVIGIPISKVWEPIIRYESRAFETRATPRRGVCIVDRDAPEDATEDCPGTMGELKIASGFETLIAGVRYDHSRTSSAVVTDKGAKVPPIFVGIGLMQYRKPYQLNLDGFTLEDYLFDGRFRGAGIAGGVEFGGGFYRFFGDLDVQVGLGEVSLTDSITLNELVPKDQLIGYVQGTGTLGYRWPLIRAAPTLILVPTIELGGASFFLVDTQVSEDERATSPAVNWDVLWSASLSLLIPL